MKALFAKMAVRHFPRDGGSTCAVGSRREMHARDSFCGAQAHAYVRARWAVECTEQREPVSPSTCVVRTWSVDLLRCRYSDCSRHQSVQQACKAVRDTKKVHLFRNE
jgi:hypothetical protein